jgi:predicted permease
MVHLILSLTRLYIPLIFCVGLGVGLGYALPPQVPEFLGKALFWFGVPFSIFVFLRQTDLSDSIWLAPIVAWVAMLLGVALAWMWIRWRIWQGRSPTSSELPSIPDAVQGWSKPSQGSFLLTSMLGNTGYLGYPVALALVGPQYFAWAVFYDTIGSTLGAYGLGVMLAAYFGMGKPNLGRVVGAIAKNPALLGFGLGIWAQSWEFPTLVETTLKSAGWLMITLALMLLGMRLGQLRGWHRIPTVTVSLLIKMLIVPLVIGVGLFALGLDAPAQLILVLQAAMPPAFATLIISEAFDLDRKLTVTSLAMGSGGLLLTIPLWLLLFGHSPLE